MRVVHRAELGIRQRPLFGALRLRPPVAEVSPAEARLLARAATGVSTYVEIGVAEGGSASVVRPNMAADGTMHLIDPYTPGRLGISLTRLVARRVVRSADGQAGVDWVRDVSHRAVDNWSSPIDLLFIDGDHSFDAVKQDWEDWSPFVTEGGSVAFHDALPAPWTSPDTGPVRFVRLLQESPHWKLTEEADSLALFSRVSSGNSAQ